MNYNDKIHLAKLKESRKEIGSNNNGPSVATSGSVAYDEKMKDGFKNLIAQLRNRQKGIKRKAEDSTIGTSLSLEDCRKPKMSRAAVPRAISSTQFSSPPTSSVEMSKDVKPKHSSMNARPFISASTTTTPKRKDRTSPTRQTKIVWECGKCTFENEVISWSRTKQSCKMCGAQRVENKEKVASSTNLRNYFKL